MTTQWLRVTKAKPCPICGKPDWCGVSADGTAAACMRIESDRRTKNGGWLHRLGSQPPEKQRRRCPVDVPAARVAVAPLERRAPSVDWERLQRTCFATLIESQLVEFATRLNVRTTALSRLGVGWAPGNAYSFPMRAPNGAVVGIRLRRATGKPWCVLGSHHGLFIGHADGDNGPVFVCEGESDTAAMLGLGLDAVGVPGAGTCVPFLKDYLRRRDVVVMADRDEAGRRGAERIAGSLGRCCNTVRLMFPRRGKDVREWFTLSTPNAGTVLAVARARNIY